MSGKNEKKNYNHHNLNMSQSEMVSRGMPFSPNFHIKCDEFANRLSLDSLIESIDFSVWSVEKVSIAHLTVEYSSGRTDNWLNQLYIA